MNAHLARLALSFLGSANGRKALAWVLALSFSAYLISILTSCFLPNDSFPKGRKNYRRHSVFSAQISIHRLGHDTVYMFGQASISPLFFDFLNSLIRIEGKDHLIDSLNAVMFIFTLRKDLVNLTEASKEKFSSHIGKPHGCT